MHRRRPPDVVVCFTVALAAAVPNASAEAAEAQPGSLTPASHMRSIGAARRVGPVVLDGRLDEAAWEAAPWGDRFTQADPDEGTPFLATARFTALWDPQALHVAVECADPPPPPVRL